MLAKVEGVITTVGLGAILFFILVMCAKLTIDLWKAPNIFIKEEPVKLNQKEIDSMCVKWWTESDLAVAKKRVCGK
jgi:hypothetical protein